MKAAIAVLIVLGIGVGIYFYFVPPNTFIMLTRKSGAGVTLSRSGISLNAAPELSTNTRPVIEAQVKRLIASKASLAVVIFSSPDGKRAFALNHSAGDLEASFMIDSLTQPDRESAIRKFFQDSSAEISDDYLTSQGRRALSYRLAGRTEVEITALCERILPELCGLMRGEPVKITFLEK